MHRIELGFACNNACAFCPVAELRRAAEAARGMTAVELGAVAISIDALPPGQVVAFVGGEPTLVEELPELVRRARAREPRRVLLQTNARRLAVPGYAEQLVQAGVGWLDVSVHGANEPMHDYHTGLAGSFRQTVAGLRRARAVGLPFGVTSVVTRSSFRHLAEIVRVAHALGARAVHLARIEPVGDAARNQARLIPAEELVQPELARAIRVAESLGLGVLAADTARPDEVREQFAGRGRSDD